jgi:S-adenosylmethionine:diacylglycerol 3-amino-3-carboxypropyl transferase
MTELARQHLGGREGGLAFAQVHEDPSIEIAALAPRGAHLVGISSGGDTALGLLAAGAARVSAIDVNRTQNHHVELAHRALTTLERADALALFGVHPATGRHREMIYRAVAPALGVAARAWWDAHPRPLRRGLAHAGHAERRLAAIAAVAQRVLTGPDAVRALMACTDTASQQAVYDRQINTRRWRAGLAVTFNPATVRPLYPQFFRHIDVSLFTRTVHSGIVAAFRDLPVWQNWYLHDLCEGRYRADCLPPHLRDADLSSWGALELIDGDIRQALATLPAHGVDGVWLSNVGEWLPRPQFAHLLRAAADVVRPGGRVVWSFFVPRADPVPAEVRDRLALVGAPEVLDRSVIRFQRVVAEVL